MAFEGLSDKLEAAFKRLRSKGSLNENDVKEAMREVRLALLEADVNYKVAKDFTNKVTERAIGAQVMESLTPAQMVIKIVNEELTALMGGTGSRLACAAHPPTIVMMCGLQGSGKTTHCAKIARKLKSEGHRPLLVACDVYRPAAIKQLQVVGEQADVPVFEMGQIDPVEIAKNAVRYAKDHGYDYVFIDTAGIRRKSKVEEAIERYSVLRAYMAIDRSNVCIIMIDATRGFSEQDSKIAGYAHEQGKACIIAVNKWDAVEDKTDKTMQEMKKKLENDFSFMPYAPMIFISAMTGQRVGNLYEMIKKVDEQNARRISTGMLNDMLSYATARVQPPSDKGRRLKIYYVTQVSVKPPTFVVFVNDKELMHFSYTRYLENKIREAFGFKGTSLKFIIRERKEKD